VSFDEIRKPAYQMRPPSATTRHEVWNSDVDDVYPNPSPVGNGGSFDALGLPLDGFAASGWHAVPANGALLLVRG
jgi:hypothetical protein